MEFVETSSFSRQRDALFTEDSFRELTLTLAERPEAGAIIRGGGGIRKLRWAAEGRGKRGGTRVIYYWASDVHVVLLLLAYPKNMRDDLTAAQLKALRTAVESEHGT